MFIAAAAGDDNGIINHIATNGKQREWSNPRSLGALAVKYSDGIANAHLVLERGTHSCGWCTNATNKYIEINLKEHAAV